MITMIVGALGHLIVGMAEVLAPPENRLSLEIYCQSFAGVFQATPWLSLTLELPSPDHLSL